MTDSQEDKPQLLDADGKRSASSLAARYQQEHPDADRLAIEVSLRITDCYLSQYEAMLRVLQGLGNSASEPRYGVLRALYFASDGYLTPTEIRHAIRRAPPNVTYILDELEKEGLLLRSSHPEDRRAVRVSLTAAGVEFAKTRVLAMVKILGYIGAEFSSEEKEQLAALLKRFQERAETPFEV
jgi:DNA-binding MarR family transcriptional regulator